MECSVLRRRVLNSSRRVLPTLIAAVAFLLLPFAHAQSSTSGLWLSSPIDQSQLLGGNVTFDCLIRNLGNRNIIWNQVPDDRTIDSTVLFVNSLNFNAPDRYASVKLPDGTGYRLEITNILEEDDATYECTVQQLGKMAARLTVLVVPGTPKIATNASVTRPSREGDVIQLTCNSSGGNPAPNITWYRNGLAVSSSGVTSSSSSAKFGLTSGSFVRRLTSNDDRANYTCTVMNRALPGGLSTTLLLNVQYAPVITFGRFNPLAVVESTDVTVTCTVTSNPPVDVSTIRWYRSGSLKGSGSTLSLKSISAINDDGVYSCSAANSVNSSSAQFTIDVQYPPRPTIQLQVDDDDTDNSTVVEGSSVSLGCSSTDANPPASAAWWSKDGLSIKNGGQKVVVLGTVRRTQAGQYICTAVNTLTPSGGQMTNGTGNASISLRVLYKPGKTSISQPSQIVKGDNVTLTCAVDDIGNPPATLSWSRAGDVNVISTGATLTIRNIQMTDGGNYTCLATNSLGNGIPFTTTLDLYERPEWYGDVFNPQTLTSTNQSGVLGITCRVRGRPKPTVSWSKDGLPIDDGTGGLYRVEDQSDYRVDLNTWLVSSSLYWQGEHRGPTDSSILASDAGNYTCEAINILLTSPIEQTTRLIVYYPPMIRQHLPLVATDLHQTAVLSVVVTALPAPDFKWFNGSSPIRVDNSRVKVSVVAVDQSDDRHLSTLFRSTLTLMNVDVWDLTSYTCVVGNDYGKNETTVQLTRSSYPESPRNLSVVTSSWESVALSWLAGFDGGRQQTFTIAYAVLSDTETATSDDGMQTITTNGTQYNVTGLYPSVTYSFIVCSRNSIGRSVQCANVTCTTAGFTIVPSKGATFNVKTNVLSFTPPGANYADYCVRIDIGDSSGVWTNYVQCKTIDSASMATVAVSTDVKIYELRLSFCLVRRHDVCSQSTVVTLVTTDVSASTAVVVGCVCGIIVVALVIVLTVVCCRRRHLTKKGEQASSLSTHSSPVSSDMAVNVNRPASKPMTASAYSASVDLRSTENKDAPTFVNRGAPMNHQHHHHPHPHPHHHSAANGFPVSQRGDVTSSGRTHPSIDEIGAHWSSLEQRRSGGYSELQQQLQFLPYVHSEMRRDYVDQMARLPNGPPSREPPPAYRTPPSGLYQNVDRSSFGKPKKIIHEVIV